MAYTNKNKDHKRREIDPKKIKKHSNIVRQFTNSTRVSGEREATKSGFKAGIYNGKMFESYYEQVMEGASSDLVMHDKKYRTLRVLSGTGFLLTVENPTEQKELWKLDQRPLIAGDVIECEPGKAYRLATTDRDILELVVTQEPKYDSKLAVLEESEAVANITEDMLNSVSRSDIINDLNFVPVRRGSKAREQQAAIRGDRPEVTERPVVQPTINKNPQADLAAYLASSDDG